MDLKTLRCSAKNGNASVLDDERNRMRNLDHLATHCLLILVARLHSSSESAHRFRDMQQLMGVKER
jgi:hypothetical protein